jgi:DNA-binding NarL/FixJ family response regulator
LRSFDQRSGQIIENLAFYGAASLQEHVLQGRHLPAESHFVDHCFDGKGMTLAPLEEQILKFLVEGMMNREIAKQVGLTEYALKARLLKIYDKSGMGHRTELALWYLAKT